MITQKNSMFDKKINALTGLKIQWLSPLKDDEFAEYRDTAFLKKIGLRELSKELQKFWPKNGPQWDALGTSENGAIILVEAKANVPELVSFCGAIDKDSLLKISKSLHATQRWLNCREPSIDWKCGFYQYANRLAHLYFLTEKAGKEAYLIFLYFVCDFTHIPTSYNEWTAALELQKKLMGIATGRLMGKVFDIVINTKGICADIGA
jgi:hypothetical protein